MASAARFANSGALVAIALLCLQPSAEAQGPGAIQGRIISSTTERPLGFALVTVLDSRGREVATSLTNSAGYYAVRLPAGFYRLTVSASGYGTQQTGTVQVFAGAQIVGTDFFLARQTYELAPLVVSVGRTVEKAIGAPAHVETVTEADIRSIPSVTLIEHLRDLPGVDIITQGIQSTNPVLRGFNNVFSGGLHMIADNRLAGVPSLRGNVMSFVPTTAEDIDRMEVVLGPGSALYGPNTAHGVLHAITKSPLREPDSSVSVTGGEKGLFRAAFRLARPFSERFGVKLSGQLMSANEWGFDDEVEVAERDKFDEEPTFWREDLMRATGIDAEEADRRIARIGMRDYDISRIGAELRSDWAITDDATVVLSGGITNAANQIELTPLGAAQVQDWRYTFYQARLNWGRLFAQVYLNQSEAGDTFLLRNGAPIRDTSRLFSGQLQYASDVGLRQRFTYGVDYFFTDPRTAGTINGIYEDEDRTNEVGGYLQSETQLTSTLDLVLAGRVDNHSLLPDPIFSPRAALVFEPAEDHAIRATYNRAFTTPTSLNQFLDLGTAIPDDGAARLGYSIRVQGTGTTGFRFRDEEGAYQMRSPSTPAQSGGPRALLPAEDAAILWSAAVQAFSQQAAQAGVPVDSDLVGLLLSLQPTPAEIGSSYFDFVTQQSGPLASLELRDIEPIRESAHSTYELGYSGLLGERAALSADLWYSRRKDMVTPITIQTPFITMTEADVASFLVPRLVGTGMPQAEAEVLAAQLASGIARVPVGVISSPEINANGAQLLATFTNVRQEIDLWGVDVSATVLLSELWSLAASGSYVSEEAFRTERGPIFALNAPTRKGSVSLEYRDSERGLSGEIRARLSGEFPAASGVFEGLACLGDPPEDAEPCVRSYALLDVSLSSEVPGVPGAAVQLSVQNLLDEGYRSFPGVPDVGRLALVRLQYDF